MVAVIVSVISIGANWYVSHTTEKIQVDLNQVKGKLAEYDTLVVKNITSNAPSNTIYFPCPNGTRPTMSGDEKGITIECVLK